MFKVQGDLNEIVFRRLSVYTSVSYERGYSEPQLVTALGKTHWRFTKVLSFFIPRPPKSYLKFVVFFLCAFWIMKVGVFLNPERPNRCPRPSSRGACWKHIFITALCTLFSFRTAVFKWLACSNNYAVMAPFFILFCLDICLVFKGELERLLK